MTSKRLSALCLMLTLLSTVWAIASYGITGTLEGRIRDKQSRDALPGANIQVMGTTVGGISNADGTFRIANIRAGVYDIKVSLIGYQPVLIRSVTIVQDQRTKLEVDLEPGAVETPAMEIRAVRPLIQTDQAATVFSIGEAKLDMLPVSTFREVLTLQPGTTLEGNVRGGKTNEVLFLIDGLPVQDVVGGGLGASLPKSAITGLTIHTGGFEAEYGNALSGVVNVVTKSGGEKNEFAVRLDRDSWIPSRLNKQQDRSSELEVSASGTFLPHELTYFTANNIQITDTRWWQDFQNFFDSPVQTEYAGFGKLEYTPGPSSKVSLQGIYSYKTWRDYEFSWRYNLAGLPERKRVSSRVSLGYNYAISENAFLTTTLNRYDQRNRLGQEDGFGSTLSVYEYDFYLQYIVNGARNWWADAHQVIYTFKTDFTSTLQKSHLIKAGVEFNQYTINSDLVKYEPQTTYFGKPIVDAPLLNYSNSYSYTPRSGSIYVQDKIDLEQDGSIISVGLRWDFLDPTAERPVVEFIPSGSNEFRDTVKGFAPASFKQQLSPRISFAAPVGGTSFFFMNFGQYFQFPVFDYLYSGISPVQLRQGARNVQAGNPDLEPERTVSWELGFKHGIDEKHVASVTYFRKRMLNQIDAKTLIPFDSKSAGDYGFASYVNNAEANSSGLEFVVSRERDERFSGSLSYTYMSAEGISESVDQGINIAQWGFPLPPRPFPLSWDQRHTIKADADFLLVGDIRVNFVGLYNSARPYTYYPTRDGFTPIDTSKAFLANNARMESVAFVNVKVSREFSLDAEGRVKVLMYADIRNLLNKKNVRWIDSNGRVGGELSDPSAYYDPRRVRVGVKVDF